MRAVAWALAALLALTGCSGGSEQRERVTYLTGVGLQGREAYAYVALEKGWFADAGFDVEVVPGNGTNQNLQLLQSGRADFAVVDITAALIEHAKRTFTDFAVVGALHQRTLACLMALDGGGITKAADLAGKRIAYIPGGVVRVLFEPWARLSGADPAGVRWVTMPATQMGPALAAGSIDAATQFVVGRPGVEAAAKGRPAVVLPYADVLPDLYGNGLAVGTRAVADDPERVRRFSAAMLKGLTYATEHPDEAADIFAKHQKTQPAAVAAAELRLLAPYVKPAAGPVGSLDPAQATRAAAILFDAGAIPAPLDPARVLAYDLAPGP